MRGVLERRAFRDPTTANPAVGRRIPFAHRADIRSIAIGAALLLVGLFLAFGRTWGASITAIAATSAVVAGVLLYAWRPKTQPVTRTAALPDLFGVPPVNAVIGLTVIGLAIRLVIDRGLWLDEAIGVEQAQMSFNAMLDALRNGDNHPPLYPAILWITTHTIGTSALAVRLPSIIAGTALIPLLYLAARDLYNRRVGVMAAALGTFAPLLVWYSQEARMYSVLLLFSVAAVWFQVRAIRSGRLLDQVAFGACCAAMLWTHYFSIAQIATQHAAMLALVVLRRRRDEPIAIVLKGWAISMIAMLVVLAPLVPFILDQLASSSQLEGLGVPSRNPRFTGLSIYSILANAVWALWGYHSATVMQQIVALWPLMMLFVLFLLGRTDARVMWLLGACVVVPIFVMFVAGMRLRDLFEVRYFITIVPLLLILIARFAARVDASRVATGVVATVLLASFGIALTDQQLNQTNPRVYDFEHVLTFVDSNADEDDVLLYAPYYLESVVNYYAPDVRSRAMLDGPPDVAPGQDVFVVTAPPLLDRRETPDALGRVVGDATYGRRLVEDRKDDRVNLEVWR